MKKDNKERTDIEEIANLDFKTLRSLIKYYREQYDEVHDSICNEGWTKEKCRKASFLTSILSDYEYALHYKNVITSTDDEYSTAFHNVCRKVGK